MSPEDDTSAESERLDDGSVAGEAVADAETGGGVTSVVAGETAEAGETGDAGDTDDAAESTAPTHGSQVEAAIREVRREARKAALLHALVEAAVLGLAVNLLLAAFGPVVSREVRLASVAVVALFALVLGVKLRMRRPLVERFERLNPVVNEALRTARDSRARGSADRMATALYADVLGRLRETSSTGLVDSRRLAVSLVVLLVLSLVTAQVTITGLDIGEFEGFDVDTTLGGGGGGGGGGATDVSGGTGGLQEGSLVLGEPEDVEAGSEELPVGVDVSGGGGEAEERVYNTGGFGDGTAVEAQRAGFAPPEVLEDADLIREYNLQIREEEDE